MNNIIQNIYTNYLKFPNNKIILNIPRDKQKPVIEVKKNTFFIPKHLYIQSNIKNIELFENDEYIKTIKGDKIDVNSLCYYTHYHEFCNNKKRNSIKVKFISPTNSESISIYNFNLSYDNTIKEVPENDSSIDFNNVREMLSGIQISDDAKNMLNNIESSSKMFNSLFGNINPNEMNSTSFFSPNSIIPISNIKK
ncbi:hypothetical protein BCR36DRAFT_406856 [Piromyces finnis]|uniref:Uncharacterized protein n=1 Tax=Piromyces finnis TaxID=1754191 RepID=A0A1Y1UXY9_9FUNG|nr:hypothetical protein BCR36DRAFT_406856 [Piromyces finnis]|eukprot:ORX43110.1 hypothetical protein BCR36DRAFT_406856 [Piromyces finnis]